MLTYSVIISRFASFRWNGWPLRCSDPESWPSYPEKRKAWVRLRLHQFPVPARPGIESIFVQQRHGESMWPTESHAVRSGVLFNIWLYTQYPTSVIPRTAHSATAGACDVVLEEKQTFLRRFPSPAHNLTARPKRRHYSVRIHPGSEIARTRTLKPGSHV